MRSLDGAVLIGVILLAGTVGLFAFVHVTSSALRLLAAGNGMHMLQTEATLDATAWHTLHHLQAGAIIPEEEVPPFTFAGKEVTRTVVWASPGLAAFTFSVHGAVRTVSYDVTAPPFRIVSFE